MKSHNGGRILFGLLLIGIGVLFILNRFYSFDIDIGYIFSTYWPVFIIYFSLVGFLKQRKYAGGHGSAWWGLIGILVGCYFLARNLGILDVGFSDLIVYAIPALLILFGLKMILRPAGQGYWDEHKQNLRAQKDEWKEERKRWKEEHRATRRHHRDAGLHGHDPHGFAEKGAPGEGEIRSPLDEMPEYQVQPEMPEIQPSQDPVQNPGEHVAPRWETPVQEAKRDGSSNGAERWDGREAAFSHASDAHRTTRNESGFVGDVYLGHDYWKLENMNISLFIGDTVLDLTKADIPSGTTKLVISIFIGDVKIFIPADADVEASVVSSSFVGDKMVFEQRDEGLFKSISMKTPDYDQADKKLHIVVSQFIGDLMVQRVG